MHLRKISHSTGFRFAVLHTLVFVASVGLIGWLTDVTVAAALTRQAHQRVNAEMTALTAAFERDGSAGLAPSVQSRLTAGESRLRYAVVDREKHLVMGDRGLIDYVGLMELARETKIRQLKREGDDSILIADQRLPDGTHVLIADDLESVEDVQDVISDAFLVALGVAVALGFGGGALLTSSLLRRVDAVTQAAEAIIGGNFSRRIERTGSGDDFDRLAATLNAMLDRIAGLMENLKQVSSDIAHDLRTPLARLRQDLESARGRAATLAEYEHALDRALVEADKLLDTFSALLRIAQIESGARRSAFRMVDLSDVMRTVAEAYEPAVEDGGRCLRTEIEDRVQIEGDRELLTQLFANLVENTLHHTPRGTAITLHLACTPEGPVAEVADDGFGVPKLERANIFRRFYRLERSRTTPGNGLGLSMVAAIAELHQASIHTLDNSPGLRIVVRFQPVEV